MASLLFTSQGKALLMASLPLISNTVLAQQKIESETTMTVTATGNERNTFEVPAIVDVVNGDSPWSKTSTTAASMLKGVAGLTFMGVGRTDGQTINMRGYDKNGVLTLVDGIKQISDMDKSSATFLDPALVKRVDVVRGPMASLYGSGALGGVINYQLVDAADLLAPGQDYGFRVFSQGGTGDHSIGGGASFFGKSEQLDGVLSVITRKRGDIKQSDGFNAPTDETPGSVFAKGQWQIDDSQSFGASVRAFRNDTREPGNPTLSTYTAENGEAQRHISQRDLQLTYHLKPQQQNWLDLESQVYSSEVSDRTKQALKGTSWRESTMRGAKLTNRSNILTDFAAHQIILQGEYYQQRQNPSGATTLYPPAKISFWSGMLQDEITLQDLPASIQLGSRFDRYEGQSQNYDSLTANRWSPKAALNVTPTDWLLLFGSVSSAFRAPSMGEMYRSGVHFYRGKRPNYWVPNPDLQPETNLSQEIGAGLRFDDMLVKDDSYSLKGSYFDTRAKNYIDTKVDMKKMQTTSYNVPKAHLWGWDIQSRYTHPYVDWTLSYNHTDGIDTQTRQYIDSISPDTLVSDLSVPLPLNGVSAGWRSTLVAPTTHVADGNPKQPGFVTHALSLNYRAGSSPEGFETSLVVDNIFDKEAFSPQGRPYAARTVNLFLSYQW